MHKYKNGGDDQSFSSGNFGRRKGNSFNQTDESHNQTLVLKLQNSLYIFFHNLLEEQVFSPFLYALILIISFFQQQYFIMSGLELQMGEDFNSSYSYGQFLGYLPLFPTIILNKVYIGYIFFFIWLFLLQLVFLGIVIFNFIFAEYMDSSGGGGGNAIIGESLTSINFQKKSISSTYKIVLKVLSFYLIIQKELLTIPSLYFIFDVLICNTNFQNLESDNPSTHIGTNLECWSSQYIVLGIISLIHLVILFVTHFFQLIYMNDPFPEFSLPWSQSTIKPQILNLLLNLLCVIWYVLRLDVRYQLILNVFIFIVTITCIVLRIIFPTIQSDLIKKVTLAFEIGRLWSATISIFLELFKIKETQYGIILETIIFIFLFVLILKMVDYRINKVLIKGINSIQNSNHLEIFFSKIYELISLDHKKSNIILQGMLQFHIKNCHDDECPCFHQQVSTLDDNVKHKKLKHDFSKITLTKSNSHFGRKEHIKIENAFMDQFQLRKSQDTSQKKKFQQHQEDQTTDTEEKNKLKQREWFEFLRYQLVQKICTVTLTVDFHYTLSGFYFLKIKNEFKSLFELILAQDKNPNLQQKFLIYRHKRRIEKIIQQKHEKSQQVSRKLNIISVYEYEKNYTLFQKLIIKNTASCQKFWNELLEKEINVARMHGLGIQISENHQTITKTANFLLKIYPNQIIMLLNYSKYLSDIINNEFSAIDYFRTALQQRINLRQKQKLLNSHENEDVLFGENSFCSIFIVKAEGKQLGIIEYVNEEVSNLLGYTTKELISKDINTIIPKIISRVHYNLLIKFFDKAESSVLNKVRELFAKDKEGYLVPIYLFSKVLPNLTNGLKLIGVIKKIQHLTFQPELPTEFLKMPQEYILCDAENNIQNFSYGMTTQFGLFPKMFLSANGNSLFDQDVNIDYLSSDFQDKQIELQEMGTFLEINTNKLLEKVDREVLSNEEFRYFNEKSGVSKVFCQMQEMNFSNIVKVKLYRIIQFQKFQMSQKQLSLSQTKEESEFLKSEQQNLSVNIMSHSSQSSSASTQMSMNKELKEFKKQMTENIEPRIVKFIRRFLQLLLVFMILMTTMIFSFSMNDRQSEFNQTTNTLRFLKLQNKFVQLQNNLRTLLNLANNIDTNYANIYGIPYSSRFEYLNTKNQDLIEEIRSINNYLTERQDKSIRVYEIDKNHNNYSYLMQYDLCMGQYIVRALELANRTQKDLQMPTLLWTVHENQTINNLNAFISAYFVINTGYKSLVQTINQQVQTNLFILRNYKSLFQKSILWLSIVSLVFLFSAQILLIAVIQRIENNKVGVLRLYSEIKVIDVKESITKCKSFQSYLFNVSDGKSHKQGSKLSSIDEERNEFQSDVFTHNNDDDLQEDFNSQWMRFIDRLSLFRVNQQKESIENLKIRLNQEQIQLYQQNTIINDANQKQAFENKQTRGEGINSKITVQDLEQKSLNSQANLNGGNGKNKKNKTGMRNKSSSKRNILQNSQRDDQDSEQQSYHDDSDEDSQDKRGKNKKIINQDLRNINDIKDMTEDARIGKHEQFSKIKTKNWKQIIFVLIQTSILMGYFFFAILFQDQQIKQVHETSFYLEISYQRQIQINQMFGFFRERLMTNQIYIDGLEFNSESQFYQNENSIQDQQNHHPTYFEFLFDYFSTIDSQSFCDDLELKYNLKNCTIFKEGLLKQGVKSALFTFDNYYSKLNISSTKNQTLAKQVLNSLEIQSFFVASETYFSSMSDMLDNIWDSNIKDMSSQAQDMLKVIFIIFLLVFLLAQVIMTRKIINQLNETTWRSRGILNLVPNNLFKEMKQNTKILKMLKT